jgi:PAS domain S-box-containing protein
MLLARSFLGDIAMIDEVQEHAPRRHFALDRSSNQEAARAAIRLGTPRSAAHPVSIVIRTKQPVLVAEITPEYLARVATSAEHARMLNAAQTTSAMFVPLMARGQLLAVLSIVARNGSRRYNPDDLRLAMELARRAALTLDNVQLFQESRLQGAVTTNLAEGAILVRAADSTIVYANPRAEALFGYAPRELLCRCMSSLHAKSEDTKASPAVRIAQQLEHADAWHDELECLRKDGSPFWCAVSASNFDHAEHGRVWIAVYTDVTERKRLEQQTAQALVEKEVLLKEIHHRVKNNLQVICSLFSLQRSRTHNVALRSLLDESRTRVESIALVHEQLYRSTDVAAIDFSEYLRRLIDSIRSGYGAEAFDIEVRASNVVLDVDHAVPCALLVCELVSNSLKHAFGSSAGRIWVRAERDENGYCNLDIGDDGRGLPADFDWTKTRSLGLRLVQGFARQLRASIVVERCGGTRFRLRFQCRSANNAKPRERLAAGAAR